MTAFKEYTIAFCSINCSTCCIIFIIIIIIIFTVYYGKYYSIIKCFFMGRRMSVTNRECWFEKGSFETCYSFRVSLKSEGYAIWREVWILKQCRHLWLLGCCWDDRLKSNFLEGILDLTVRLDLNQFILHLWHCTCVTSYKAHNIVWSSAYTLIFPHSFLT